MNYPEAPRIQKTTNYGIFRHLNFNRNLDKTNLTKLRKQTEKRFQMHKFPIIVNKNYEIIDGQHRFEVCRDMGTPVYYIVENKEQAEISDVRSVNIAGRRHTITDRIEMLEKEGDSHVIAATAVYNAFEGRFRKACVVSLVGFFNTGGNIGTQIDEGNYRARFESEAYDLLYKLDTHPLIPDRYSEKAVFAFADVIRSNEVRVADLIERCSDNAYMFTPSRTRADYVNNIMKAYNYRLTEKNRLDYKWRKHRRDKFKVTK